MTQHELIISYLRTHKSITPAKMSGKIYKGFMFGSELPRRCRELREDGLLHGERDGKFMTFTPSAKLLKKQYAKMQ